VSESQSAVGESRASASVDIGLTAYRRATYLAEAIESVLAQSFPDWRLVVCDNGPGGGEIEHVVRRYLDDDRISYLATGRELPLAENWTNALNQGTAPYTAVLNDDDRYHPDYLARRVEALEAHPECGFAFAEWVGIDEHGNQTLHVAPKFAEGVIPRVVLGHWFTKQNLVTPPAIVLRRSALENVGSYFDGKWQYCDWELWARVAARYPVYYLGRPDNDFRRHPDAYTFSERESADHLLAMVDEIEGYFVRDVPGFQLTRVERVRNRSQILLHIAGDTHRAGGWKASWPLYRRALRLYPLSIFERTSVGMLGRSLLGRRGSLVASRALRALGRRGDGSHESATT
jgi:glycosyltransferase involved in cell wall biosynthesis